MGVKKYKIDESFFETIDNEEKAYFLGWMFSDGYVYKSDKISQFSLNLHYKDEEILKQFCISLKTDRPLQIVKENGNNALQKRLSVSNKPIVNSLIKLGCFQNKSKILDFPEISLNLRHHFIRGFFDGDGSVWEGKRIKAKIKENTGKIRYRIIHNTKFNISTSLLFLQKLQNILVNELKFKPTKLNNSKSIEGYAQMEYSGRLQMKKFYEYLYKDATIFLKRKKNKFEQILNFKK